jgi:hypothetical protein
MKHGATSLRQNSWWHNKCEENYRMSPLSIASLLPLSGIRTMHTNMLHRIESAKQHVAKK